MPTSPDAVGTGVIGGIEGSGMPIGLAGGGPAPGLGGGEPGACGEVAINGVAVDSRRPHVLAPGDEVMLRTPGGGGYGPASERSGTLTSHDRLQGYTG